MESSISSDHIAKTYQTFSSVEFPTNAVYTPRNSTSHFIIESTWRTSDFAKLQNTTGTRNHIVFLNEEKAEVVNSLTYDTTAVLKTAHSPSGKYRAVLTQDNKNEANQFIEIWKENRKIHTFDVLSSNLHGKIYDDDFMGTLAWNKAEDTLLYVAEKYVPKSLSYFKQTSTSDGPDKDALKGQEFVYREDWGEGYPGKCSSVICTLNIDSEKVVCLPIKLEQEMSLCQPVWGSDDRSIYFVGILETPFRLGIKFCSNRVMKIFNYDFGPENTKLISCEGYSSYSPRLSPDGQVLVHLENGIMGPHHTCNRLVKIDAIGRKVVVEVVKKCSGDDFPGIYNSILPSRCFSSDGRYIFFSSNWRSKKAVLCVNLVTGNVTRISVDASVTSCTVYDVYDDVLIASASAPNVEPYLMIGKVSYSSSSVAVSWHNLDKSSPRLVKDINCEFRVLDPPEKNLRYPHLTYEIIILTPSGTSTCQSLIMLPHGGPHSVFSGDFSDHCASLVKLGFAICMVNYRGSLGFGLDCINSLLGNIGSQDISDVHHAMDVLKKESYFKNADVFVLGGSHGGFIGAHMNAKYPESIVATVLRNPVVDLAGKIESTDIPDWAWVESAMGDDFNYKYPDLTTMGRMWDLSPIKFVDKATVPTLLLLGKRDRRVPCSQGLKYHRALKVNNVPSRVFMFDDGHSLMSFPAHSDGFMEIVLWFLKFKALKRAQD